MSRLSAEFLMLLSGASVIATLGLFQNSPAVIIGAMIIAPLMKPILALSFAILSADTRLLIRAIISIAVGTTLAIFLAATAAILLNSIEPGSEILGRTHPTLLDLGVAIAAGVIGAYCQAKPGLADSAAGVAIAVALVPPLSVVGIGLASSEYGIWSGALLLFATNLVGISFAGSVVFLLMGFTPLKQAKKGLIISCSAMFLLLVPLALSMRELILENILSTNIKNILKEKTYTFRGIHLQSIDVKRFQTPIIVTATVLSNKEITAIQVKLVEDFLSRETGTSIKFHLRKISTTEISSGELEQSASETDLKDRAKPVTAGAVKEASLKAQTHSEEDKNSAKETPSSAKPEAESLNSQKESENKNSQNPDQTNSSN
ncbi:MAG: DUF389 domain-containing protein [Candidatus Obscuribacterales bacterium]|nr:DUF389 domain-containing protein [Candidatus Obscuribacterales bacterium]